MSSASEPAIVAGGQDFLAFDFGRDRGCAVTHSGVRPAGDAVYALGAVMERVLVNAVDAAGNVSMPAESRTVASAVAGSDSGFLASLPG